MNWALHHREETLSTNSDAASGRPGDVFTANYQSGGRGRLDHKWHSRRGENLMMSAVVGVEGLMASHVATLPIVAGLATADAVCGLLPAGKRAMIKWPNDILVGGRKLAGILCERHDDRVVVGVGVNVLEESFPSDIAERATSLRLEGAALPENGAVEKLRDAVLAAFAAILEEWRQSALDSLMGRIAEIDFLRGREIEIAQFDGDPAPVRGVCAGICADGSLEVAGRCIWAGEARVLSW